MYVFRFSREAGSVIKQYDSQGAVATPVIGEPRKAKVTYIYLDPHGMLGRHPAATDQLFLVVQGSGSMTGSGGPSRLVGPGEAAFFRRGEVHETIAGETGLVAVVIEGDGLEPHVPKAGALV